MRCDRRVPQEIGALSYMRRFAIEAKGDAWRAEATGTTTGAGEAADAAPKRAAEAHEKERRGSDGRLGRQICGRRAIDRRRESAVTRFSNELGKGR